MQLIRTYILAIGLGIVGGIAIDRFKYRSRFLVIFLAAAVVCCFALPGLTNHFWVAIVVTMIISGINYMIKSVYYSIMDEALIPRELTGAASGIIGLVAYVPDAFIGSLVGSWLDKDPIGGFNNLFIYMGINGVLAILCAVIINRRYIKNKA